MNTYLITWNPKRWEWGDLENERQAIKQDGFIDRRWSCGRSKSIVAGDRLFLLRQGREPRGIMASGWATSEFFEDAHFDSNAGRRAAHYVKVRFDVILNPDSDDIYSRQKLERGTFMRASRMHWDSQMSGIAIPDDVAAILSEEWANFLASKNIVQASGRPLINRSPGEVLDSKDYYEGATKSIRVNVYERDDGARLACIKHYGCSCCICGFGFEEAYGEMGSGFIHVHHVIPLSQVGKKYKVDPIKDLRPVCPNCHAMIHSRKQPYSIDDIKQRLRE